MEREQQHTTIIIMSNKCRRDFHWPVGDVKELSDRVEIAKRPNLLKGFSIPNIRRTISENRTPYQEDIRTDITRRSSSSSMIPAVSLSSPLVGIIKRRSTWAASGSPRSTEQRKRFEHRGVDDINTVCTRSCRLDTAKTLQQKARQIVDNDVDFQLLKEQLKERKVVTLGATREVIRDCVNNLYDQEENKKGQRKVSFDQTVEIVSWLK